MAQVGPFCRTCQCEKTANWKCVTCGIIMCELCNEKHLQMCQEHQSTNKSENTNFNKHLNEEIDDTKFTQIRCKYHEDYNCTDVCLSCIKVICAKCRYEKHSGHTLELIETFYQDKRTELLKCKSIIESDSLPKAKEGASLMENAEVCHSEHFEKEKQKVFKQAEALKRRITERSHKVVERLEESFQIYKLTTQNKHEQKRMEQNLKLQVKRIEHLEQNFTERIQTQNSELEIALCEINRLVNNVDNNTKQWDIPTLIPRSVKKFSPKEINDEYIDIALGDVVDCSILDEVPIRKVNVYDIKNACGNCSSLAVSKDGVIWISDSSGLLQVKNISNGKQNTHQSIKNIYDISCFKSKGLLIAYIGENVIDIQKKLGLCEKFYEKTNERLNALALHVCRDERIIILTWSNYFFFTNSVTLDIIELTNNGKLIKTIRCKGGSYRFSDHDDVFRISENINGHFCVSCEYDCKIVDFNNKGNKMWIYTECKRPIGIVTTELGNIVSIDSREFIQILNADGNFLAKLNTKEYGMIGSISALSLKSEKELLILSADKLTVFQFSTII
ncbi:unnamed protein product [Mytilus coruscus]|uniref:B box-type domain-containing protein n=1 Tax=Mytilus coruscus TaxID=42192 RepID=A0A6J8A3U2_MYTCO|nr:unnamed protein product [Mytilus coruscus]